MASTKEETPDTLNQREPEPEPESKPESKLNNNNNNNNNNNKPLLIRCQCAQIRIPIQTPHPAPLRLYHCHCTECRRQSGSAFGTSAIFPAGSIFPLSADLLVEGKLRLYTRATDSGGSMDCWFCGVCGSRLFHRARDARGRWKGEVVSVKGGCVEGLDWTGEGGNGEGKGKGKGKGKGGIHIYTRSAVMELPGEWEAYDTLPPDMM